MISTFLMASKQLFEFEKGQIVAYNDCGLSLHSIAKKLNHHHWSIDVFLKLIRKLEMIIKKKVVAAREKPTATEDTKWQCNATSQ